MEKPGRSMEPRERELVVILADISGYTRFMIENQMAAVHGQLCITSLIETMLREVDIPLQLQEIEGDALFLYAAHPGDDAAWRDVLTQVRTKLPRFFDAFFAAMVVGVETTPCECAICAHLDELKLKVIVHVGRAVFHSIAGRAQISGTDVILAHRLLKNSLPDREYLLLTEPAFRELGREMSASFEECTETYEGFGPVRIWVQRLDLAKERERTEFYALPPAGFSARVRGYARWASVAQSRALVGHLRHPAIAVGWIRRVGFALGMLITAPFMTAYIALLRPRQMRARHRTALRRGS